MLGNIGHYITIYFYIGTPIQFFFESYFFPNTMIGDLTVNSVKCDACRNWDWYPYNSEKSRSVEYEDEDREEKVKVDLGENHYIEGHEVRDRVCWQNNTDYCVRNTTFIEVTDSSTDFEPPVQYRFAGFFGLSPRDTGLGWADAPSFVDRLYDLNWIDRR